MTDIKETAFNKVILIDDTGTDLYISRRIILKNNFAKEVLQFSMAEDALKYLHESEHDLSNTPQVMFVDIHMPKMDGFQFMEAFDKLSPAFKNNFKVFMVSSSIDARDIARANNDKNILGFQEKPITKQFLEAI